jgi:Uma2 family endonuclease
MAVARRQFTVDDYHRMRDAGIFSEDDRVELLDGEVILMSPIGPLHAAIVKRINTLLNQGLLTQHIVSVQDPVQLSDMSEPQPDLAIIQYRADYYAAAHPTPDDIALVIEVSDTSLEYDRENKLLRYAESLIGEVWIIDIENQQVEQYTNPANGQYRMKQTWLHGQQVTSYRLPSVTLQVDDILG